MKVTIYIFTVLRRMPWTDIVQSRLQAFPAVALIGSRQSGKSTLARQLVEGREPPAVYLDLELAVNRDKLADPVAFLRPLRDRLVVLDEVQRVPEIFAPMRSLIDEHRTPGRFLILGSAAPSMLAQSSESLAGRIAFVELPPLGLQEIPDAHDAVTVERLWVRGGYPDSFLAEDDETSSQWRDAFVRSYLERDLPQLGVRVPSTTMERFLRMVGHSHGQLWNASKIAGSLGVTGPTARHYLDVFTEACLVRQLQPLFTNVKKRLVKSPKVYVRDSGVLHWLQGVPDRMTLYGHPVAGASFEGFVIEHVANLFQRGFGVCSFYRTHRGAEIDLVLSPQFNRHIAVEVKLATAPTLDAGFREALDDVGCEQAYVVVPSGTRYSKDERIEVIPVAEFIRDVVLPLAPW